MKKLILLFTISFLSIVNFLQGQDFDIVINVTDGTNSQNLTIGVDPSGTGGFDIGLDVLAPPPPPSGAFDARLSFMGEDYLNDIRDNSITEKQFHMSYVVATGLGPIVLRWDNTVLGALGTFFIVDDITGALYGPLDMTTVDSLVVTDPLILSGLRILVTPSVGNQPPALDPISNQNMEEGETLDVPVSSTDLDGDNITLTTENLPTFGSFIDNGDGTGTITFTPGVSTAANYPNIGVIATDDGIPPMSDTVHFDLNVGTVTINAPSNLIEFVNLSPPSVDLIWTDNSDNEDGFIIERETVTEAFGVIDSVGENVTTYTDTNVTFLTYNYRVQAYNAFGTSPYSDTSQAVIPVELTSFKASVTDNSVLLIWTTATETNNRGFDIERMTGEVWEKVGFVEGMGTTIEMTQYQYRDEFKFSSYEGTVKYRLKQIDYSGTFKYSNFVKVEVNFTPKEFQLFQNYPNPFNPNTTINYSIPSQSSVILKVFDVLGSEVMELVKGEFEVGDYEINFDASGLPSGIYFYRLQAVDLTSSSGKVFIETKKMLLLK